MFREPKSKKSKSDQTALRSIDFMDSDHSPTWGTKENPKWWKTMLSYDKNFRFLETCIEFDKAASGQNNTSKVNELKIEIFKTIDRAYDDFSKAILLDITKLSDTDKKIGDYPIEEYLSLIGKQIEAARDTEQNPREILEMVLYKLSMLRDLAKIGYDNFYNTLEDMVKYSPMNEKLMEDWKNHRIEKIPSWSKRISSYVHNLMSLDDIILFKTEIGKAFLSPYPTSGRPHNAFKQNVPVIPFYSPNGSMGFNTVLSTIFHDYLPVGFGVNPLAVHTNYLKQQALWTAKHDYGHCFLRVLDVKDNYPDFFNYCKRVYFELFNEKQVGKIDDITFKKELLVLFFLIYEIGYSKSEAHFQSLESIIKQRTLDVVEAMKQASVSYDSNIISARLLSQQYLDRKKLAKGDRPSVSPQQKEEMKNAINLLTVLETFDFVTPLQDLGYTFPEKNKKRPWEAAPKLREALLDLLDGFAKRHPEFVTQDYGSESKLKL